MRIVDIAFYVCLALFVAGWALPYSAWILILCCVVKIVALLQ